MAHRPRLMRFVAITGGVFAILAVVVVLLVGASMRAMSEDFSRTRRHLQEIRIAPNACGAVAAIHDQLNEFELSFLAASIGVDTKALKEILHPSRRSDPRSQPFVHVTWSTMQAEVGAAAQRLDGALAIATPVFPGQVRRHFSLLRADLAQGRSRLATIHKASGLTTVRALFRHGQLQAGYASDLIGNQCGGRLGADNVF